MNWMRLYTSVLHDPKAQSLRPSLFKFWIQIMLLATENDGILPPIEHISRINLTRKAHTIDMINALIRVGLVDNHDGVLTPHNWTGRQYISDDVTLRVRKHREKKQERNVSVIAVCNGPEQSRAEQRKPKKAKSAGADSPAQPGRNLFREVFSRFPRRDFNHRFEAALASVGEALMRRRLEEWRDKPGCSPTSYAEMLDVVVSGWRNDNGNGKFKSRAERDAANLRAIGEAFDFGGDTHEGIRRLGTGDPDS